jgi:hypothetical protein
MLIMAILGTTVIPALATATTRTLTAHFNNIKIVVNGELITPRDSNGRVVEPFAIDGAIYLPLRAIIDAFGTTGEWDGATQTVFIGGRVAKPALALPMFNRPYVNCNDSQNYRSEMIQDIAYTGFQTNYSLRAVHTGEERRSYPRYTTIQQVTYPLNGMAKKISGTFMPPMVRSVIAQTGFRNANPGSETVFSFYDEGGKLLHQSPIMTTTTAPTYFEFDVTNVISLRLEIRFTDNYSDSRHNLIRSMTITTTDY